MKVILLEELPGRGGEGDVIDVARGYANNYLLTHGIAIPATKGNLKQLEQRRKNIAKREEVRIANAEQMKAALENGALKIKAKVGDEGQLFGSVTAQMIATAIARPSRPSASMWSRFRCTATSRRTSRSTSSTRSSSKRSSRLPKKLSKRPSKRPLRQSPKLQKLRKLRPPNRQLFTFKIVENVENPLCP